MRFGWGREFRVFHSLRKAVLNSAMPPQQPISPFLLSYSQADVDDLRDRLRRTRWPDAAPGEPWAFGFDRDFLQDICDYWSEGFDWKQQLERLRRLHHYRFLADDGSAIHFIHERGRGPAPMPLVLTHGWPGSFLEMERILPMLSDPAAHGGDSADSFDVVVPSLPGYGFSDRPTAPGMNVFRIAEIWIELMAALGYQRFAAQGGDIGAGVSTALGLRHPDRLFGIHLNYIPGSYRPYLGSAAALSGEEEKFLAAAATWRDEHGAYAHVQGTRPQTAGYGLNDSPAGLAAWMLEKFREWSDSGGDLYCRFSRDELLTNVTLYWMTQTISSSFRLYDCKLSPRDHASSPGVGRAGIQRAALDRDAARRALCRGGGAGAAGGRYSCVLPSAT